MRVFISYRRGDEPGHAGHLFKSLTSEMGANSVFMDSQSIVPGAKWSAALEDALVRARYIVVLVGPDWLTAANEYGQRRLDDPDDWVRIELLKALSLNKEIIPVLVAGAELPPEKAKLGELQQVFGRQAIALRDDYWDHDVKLLISRLSSSLSRAPTGGQRNPYPIPPLHKPDALSDERIKVALNDDLVGWELRCSPLPENGSLMRQELFKEFTFETFQDAIRFMGTVAPGCDIAIHHPRWENVWKTLRVYLSTWDIVHRVTDRDIQLARYFDKAYEDFTTNASQDRQK